jgi:hypothetical protein
LSPGGISNIPARPPRIGQGTASFWNAISVSVVESGSYHQNPSPFQGDSRGFVVKKESSGRYCLTGQAVFPLAGSGLAVVFVATRAKNSAQTHKAGSS